MKPEDALESEGTSLFDKEIKIDAYITVGIKSFYYAGKIFKEIRDGKEYKHIPEVNTFDDYIRSRGKYSRSTVYNYIGIVEKFGEVLEKSTYLDVDHSRLIKALPYVKNSDDAKWWLGEAQNRSAKDWEDSLRDAKGKTLMVDCDHKNFVVWNKCKDCGAWVK